MKKISNFESMDSSKFEQINSTFGGTDITPKNTYTGAATTGTINATDTRPWSTNVDNMPAGSTGFDGPEVRK
jgi:hypothetical protein